ncbi:MAG TPA: NUDIX domain-containing protein [Roseiflexaceae bacterium]|nr:NUDIX domain-containing protein [Roseiflexaceae bacterium]
MSETSIVHESIWEGRRLTVRWMPPTFVPPRELTTQVYGVCFTEHRKIVLVTTGDGRWNLPGGRPEQGEGLEAALEREVWEEARARVVRSTYIGCQQVEDPDVVAGPRLYYQARFWARVEVYPFKALFETTDRQLVEPSEFLGQLFWGDVPIALTVLDCGLMVENQRGSGCI